MASPNVSAKDGRARWPWAALALGFVVAIVLGACDQRNVSTGERAQATTVSTGSEAESATGAGEESVLDGMTTPDAEPEAGSDFDVAALVANVPDVDAVPAVVQVGMLVPLSGRFAAEGEALLNAAQLALFDVADERFTLVPRDTRGTEAGAAQAAARLLDQNVDLILGPLFSRNVRAVVPLTSARGVNLIAFSTDRRVAGEGVFLLGHTSQQQVRRLVDFVAQEGLSRIALLAPDTRYGRDVAEELASATLGSPVRLVRTAYYGSDPSENARVVRDFADYDRRQRALEAERSRLKARGDEASKRALGRLRTLDTLGDFPFDALLLPDGGDRLRQIAPLLAFYDIDPLKVRLLGTSLWEDPAALNEPTLVGGWFVSPPAAEREDFEARYRATYGKSPRRIATLAYDATALAAALAQAGSRYGRDSLVDNRGFLGADGLFRFQANGLAERGLAVLEVVGGGETRMISAAPLKFDVAGTPDVDALDQNLGEDGLQ